MTETTLGVLADVQMLLLLFHSVQELVSSERTPTLSVALPAYEYCLQSLCEVLEKDRFPHLNHAIQQAIEKIDIYVKLARKNRIYGMAMCALGLLDLHMPVLTLSLLVINPSCKKSWMAQHWPDAEVDACMKAIRESVSS
jgi:hypothetical protein